MPDKKEIVVVKRDVEDADLSTMKRYYASLAEACEKLIEHNQELEAEKNLALKERDLAIQNLDQQRKIVFDNIQQSRVKELALSQELIELKQKVG